MVATFFFQRTTAFTLFLIVPSLQISCFRKTKEKQYAKYDLNKRIAARLIWQLVIHSCVIFAYIISRRDGENNGFLAGVSLPPSSRAPRAQNPLFLPFQTPATQATLQPKKLCFIYFPTARIFQKIFLNSKQRLYHVTNELLGVTPKGSLLCSCSLWCHRLLGKSIAWQHEDWVHRGISKGKEQRIIGHMRAQRDPSISTASQTG